MFEDKIIVCRDCGTEFTFSASEQEFFAEKGFTNEPGRCLPCRQARKSQRNGGRAPRQMYPATCATCGTETQVPFQPSGERPVYCSDCFQSNRA